MKGLFNVVTLDGRHEHLDIAITIINLIKAQPSYFGQNLIVDVKCMEGAI